MNITHDTVVTVIVTAALTILVLSFFYERELKKLSNQVEYLKVALLDRTFDWLDARKDAAFHQAEAFSFSDALIRHVESRGLTMQPSMDEHLATLFDEELMKGNQD